MIPLIVVALGALLAAALLINPERCGPLVALFGPDPVEAKEAHAATGATFDHQAFDQLLEAHVTPEGWVDYAALAAQPAALDAYLGQLAEAAFDGLSRDAKLALLINAYNAFTLKLMVERWPIASIKDIPKPERWLASRWTLAGRTTSLDAIEHQALRAQFKEPRIHFAIVCASVGCPPLRPEAYVGGRIEAQLEDQAQRVHQPGARWTALEDGAASLTPLYLWFGDDFVQSAGSVQAFVARYRPDLTWQGSPKWLDYDWSHNGLRASAAGGTMPGTTGGTP